MKKNSNTKRAAAFIVVLIFLGRPSMLSAKDIYVDANRGDDTNPGTLDKPFQSIQQASNAMAEGDVCTIRAGVYRETLAPTADQLTLRNYENEYVLITGLDVVTGWTPHEGSIWKAAWLLMPLSRLKRSGSNSRSFALPASRRTLSKRTFMWLEFKGAKISNRAKRRLPLPVMFQQANMTWRLS